MVNRRQQVTFQPSASRRYRAYPPVELQRLHPDGRAYPAYPDPFLRVIPAAHPPSRRTRARDIDSSGRRQNISAEMDHDDSLPAYDSSGAPPKYFELDRPPLSRITQRPDASWENINITSTENVGIPTPVGNTHPAHVSQPDTSRPTPPRLENSSSNDAVRMPRPTHETASS